MCTWVFIIFFGRLEKCVFKVFPKILGKINLVGLETFEFCIVFCFSKLIKGGTFWIIQKSWCWKLRTIFFNLYTDYDCLQTRPFLEFSLKSSSVKANKIQIQINVVKIPSQMMSQIIKSTKICLKQHIVISLKHKKFKSSANIFSTVRKHCQIFAISYLIQIILHF